MDPVVNCNLCNSRCDYLFSKEGFNFYRCTKCGYIFIYPAPDPKTLEAYYQQDYYEQDDARYLHTRSSAQQKWNGRLTVINRYLANSGRSYYPLTILDVGCATGVFLQLARKHGFDPYGIEHSDYAVNLAQDQLGAEHIYHGSFLNFQTDRKFTTITAWAVLEHVENPKSFLEKAHSFLEEGGIFSLSTVNTDSINFQIFKSNWRYLIPPEHLSYFNPKNLGTALESAGFEILETRTLFVYHAFLDGIFPKAKRSTQKIPLYWKALLYIPKVMCGWSGKGDTLEIYARKKVKHPI